jgi:hypothetical protein
MSCIRLVQDGRMSAKHFENARAPTLCNFLQTIFGLIVIKYRDCSRQLTDISDHVTWS